MLALGESRPAMDAACRTCAERLEVQHPGEADYYEVPVGTLIKQQGVHPGKVSDTAAEQRRRCRPGLPRSPHMSQTRKYDAETATNAKPTLRLADNLILYGPPGTGKTYEMQARMKAAFDRGEDFAFVAFHPSCTLCRISSAGCGRSPPRTAQHSSRVPKGSVPDAVRKGPRQSDPAVHPVHR